LPCSMAIWRLVESISDLVLANCEERVT